MLASKDFVINVFKEEIERKNQLIEQLLEKQEVMDARLQSLEEVLSYNEKNGVEELPSAKSAAATGSSTLRIEEEHR